MSYKALRRREKKRGGRKEEGGGKEEKRARVFFELLVAFPYVSRKFGVDRKEPNRPGPKRGEKVRRSPPWGAVGARGGRTCPGGP